MPQRRTTKATRRKAKPGQVLFFYGRLPGDNPDHIGMWGAGGATSRHSHAVMYGFTGKKIGPSQQMHMATSFLEDLDRAGFDITTIEFSIRVKSQTSNIVASSNPTPPSLNGDPQDESAGD